MWLPKLESRRGPVYRAIADALDEDVQNGALRAGMRLPAHRDLADHLGVTVTTVTRAYTEAARRGLTSGYVGRGTFIRGNEAEERSSETAPFDLSVNILMPDQEVANLQPRLFQRRVLPWTKILGYIPARGHLRHRQAMAAWLARGGLTVDPDLIVLTAGAQHALSSAISALLKPNDILLMEELTYSGARAVALQQHLKIRAVPMDAEGMRPEALEAACRTTRARALYCMPRLQNPTSAVMSDRRRRQIAAIADKYRLTVIEDDVYGFLSPEKAPLAALIPHRTVYLTSLSKSLFPGMRLGCVAAPAEMLDSITGAVWASMIMASPIGADLLSGWIEDGTAARIADWKRHEFTARQAMARRLFEGQRMQTHASSPHLWLQLPSRWSSESFAAHVRSRGVILNASAQFAVGDQPARAVRVCLGPPRTRPGMEQAFTIIRQSLEGQPAAARAV
jgi:DNA-binding transcriptional MocR family regulator